MLCVCPVGVLNWSLRSGTVDSKVFSDFLQKLPDGITLLLDNARVHHASRSLTNRGRPTVMELADSKTIVLKYAPPYAPHLNPVEFTFNSLRQIVRGCEAWTELKLIETLHAAFKSEAFSQTSMSKLFRSVVFGGADPGKRASSARSVCLQG